MKQFIALAALLLSSSAGAQGYLVDERPCPDQDPRLRRPYAYEWCDYVTKIKRCNGDLAERVFRQRDNPAYLMSDAGSNQPHKLACHTDK